MTSYITPSVSPMILFSIPRFFSGPQATLREIIQNSVRAGATMLYVKRSGNVISIEDNGRGLSHPFCGRPVCNLTETGKNVEKITDPTKTCSCVHSATPCRTYGAKWRVNLMAWSELRKILEEL